jgi:sugar lactone lactonase YvrE
MLLSQCLAAGFANLRPDQPMRILRRRGATRAISALGFSPSNTWLVSSSSDFEVWRWDLATGAASFLSQGSFLAFCPTGDRLAVRDNGGVVVIDLTIEPPLHRIIRSPDAFSRNAVFGPDGKTLVVMDHLVRLYELPNRKRLGSWRQADHPSGALALHGTTNLVATGHCEPRRVRTGRRANDYPVRLWRYPSGEAVTHFPQPTQEVRALAFSPDGRWLAAVGSRTLWVWEVASGRVVLRRRPDNRHFKSVAFSPDGRWLAAAHTDHTVRLSSVLDWVERESFDWEIGPIVSVCFAPDGMRAAAGSKTGRVVVWDVDP